MSAPVWGVTQMLYAVITVLLTNANSLEMPHSSSSLKLESTEGAVLSANNRFLFRGTRDGKNGHKRGKLGLVEVSLSMAGRLELDLWDPFQPKSFCVSIIPWNQLSHVPLLALNRITDNRL